MRATWPRRPSNTRGKPRRPRPNQGCGARGERRSEARAWHDLWIVGRKWPPPITRRREGRLTWLDARSFRRVPRRVEPRVRHGRNPGRCCSDGGERHRSPGRGRGGRCHARWAPAKHSPKKGPAIARRPSDYLVAREGIEPPTRGFSIPYLMIRPSPTLSALLSQYADFIGLSVWHRPSLSEASRRQTATERQPERQREGIVVVRFQPDFTGLGVAWVL